jgi:hypothetical protein
MKFFLATFSTAGELNLYEELHENYLFHCRGDDLRDCAGGGPALVQEDR